MLRKFMIAGLCLSTAPIFGSASGTVFQVEQRCREVNLPTGLRYTTPCDFDLPKLTAMAPTAVASEHVLRRLAYQDRLKLNFHCETLMPVSLKWSLGPASGSISPSLQAAALDQTLLGTYNTSDLQLTLVNPPGIQYFKPACSIAVVENYKVIDPAAVELYLGQSLKYKSTMERIFQNLSPDQSWTVLLDSLDQAIMILDFMLMSADAITAEQIQATLSQLNEAKASITVSCSAGSAAELCTAQTREGRELVWARMGEARAEVNEITAFLQAEIVRLGGIHAAAANVEKLRAVLNRHKLGA